MKRLLMVLLVLVPAILQAQIGLKGGINFANVTKVSSINNNSRTGFGASLFFAPKSKGLFGFRSEIGFSRQGYSFDTNTNTGNVNLDYILLPQLSTINITRFFQIQLGAQMAFLINSKATESNSSLGDYGKLMDYYNKFDYGVAGGLEIHPFKGLLIGGRYNLSLGNLYKKLETAGPGSMPPSFIPDVNVKNNVVNLYIGYHFVK
ncbi:MAG: porin family protein [Bacteroidota bacterium]|nr:porin family protein [Bacteroidota bacterium]